MRMPSGYHELEHILEHLPSDIEQYLLNNKIRRLGIKYKIIKRMIYRNRHMKQGG
ncbi:MAG TPA: hypothetical protein PKL04_01000 [Methanofastidiosum sp.]|nr:hypothetical protein [Methanofastidiosum sp.]